MLKLFPKDTKYLNYILFGLYVFYIGYLLNSYFFIENKLLTRPISLVGILLVLWGYYKTPKSLNGIDTEIKPLCYLFILVCFVNVIVGIPLTIRSGNTLGWLFDMGTLWMYIVFLVIFIPISFRSIHTIVSWALLYLLTSLSFSLYNFGDFYIHPEEVVSNYIIGTFDAFRFNRPQEPGLLLVPIGAFLIFYSFLKKKWRLFIAISFILALLAAMLQGRRTVSFITASYPLIAMLLYVFERKNRIAAFSIVLFLATILITQLFSIGYLKRFSDDNFVVLSERIDQNTRKAVHEDFYKDMNQLEDWILGRGMNGTYRSLQLSDVDKINRSIVETGYLNLILHGGLLMLIPYVIILLFAFYKGWFFSKNIFVKACAVYVLYHAILLLLSGHLRLTLECFVLFVFVRICLSLKWRNLSNNVINIKIGESLYLL